MNYVFVYHRSHAHGYRGVPIGSHTCLHKYLSQTAQHYTLIVVYIHNKE